MIGKTYKHINSGRIFKCIGEKGPVNGHPDSYQLKEDADGTIYWEPSFALNQYYTEVNESNKTMTRADILQEALKIVSKDRSLDYGNPEDNFAVIAKLWSVYMGHLFTAHDVAVMQILLKVSRLQTSPGKRDHWVDIAGYSACGAQAYEAFNDK